MTGNVNATADGIVIERDNVTLDGKGYTVQAPRSGQGNEFDGVNLAGRRYVTIENLNIGPSDYGIYLNGSSNNIVTGCNMTNVVVAVYLDSSSLQNSIRGNNIGSNTTYSFEGVYVCASSYNTISGNSMTNLVQTLQYGSGFGIRLASSSSNSVIGNSITDSQTGIYFSSSSNNAVVDNSIVSNDAGILLEYSSNNRIYHNNFVNNTLQICRVNSTNIWDDGAKGNYWSDYTGTDADNNGIGDTPFVIDGSNVDNYPLMKIFDPMRGDLNGDGGVGLDDLTLFAKAYGSKPGDPNWNPVADLDGNGVVALPDLVILANHYGQRYP